MTDTELVRLAAGGDRKAFAGLVERHTERIRRVTYLLLHSGPAADDVTQETFAQAMTQLDRFRGEGSVTSWLLSIALNLARKALRDEKRRRESTRRTKIEPHGILTSLVRKEAVRTLTIALGYLTEPQREAFVLHYVEEMPYEEIAPLLETSAGAARGLAHRARQVLQMKLKDLDEGSTILGMRKPTST